MNLRNWLTQKIVYILPHYCHNCEAEILSSQQYLCISCLTNIINKKKLQFLNREGLNRYCQEFYGLFDYHQVDNIQNIVIAIKMHNKSFLLKVLLQYIGVEDIISLKKVDMLAYIPLSTRRFLERGFNPSKILAEYIGKLLDIPVINIFYKQDSLAQSKKNRKERLQSLYKPMFMLKNIHVPLEGKTVCIVDDIITTGSTLENAAKTLFSKYHKTNITILGFGLFHSEGSL